MKVGFTGTQEGMTILQMHTFRQVLTNIVDDAGLSSRVMLDEEYEFHHGDCIGADAEATEIAEDFFGFLIVSHPPTNESKRAFSPYNVELPAKPYLERNHDIVNEADIMIAIPKEVEEQVRSGTWATIRYAEKKKKKLIIIFPDGSTIER